MLKLSNEQREVIAEAVRYPFTDRRTDKNLLVRLHREVFSSEICLTCEHEQIRAYIELYRLINPKDKSMTSPSKKYRFNPSRKNEQISVKGYRGVITAENLTDEMAEMLIAKGVYGDLIVKVEDSEDKPKAKAKAKKQKDDSTQSSESI
jgi:hypothetical protein